MGGKIYGINGPVIQIKGDSNLKMLEMVKVGHKKLMGEVIAIKDDIAVVQVYESTTGLKPGEPVESSSMPFSLKLAPGLLSNIFDGIERPLKTVRDSSGVFIDTGLDVDVVDNEKKWQTTVTVKKGDKVSAGDIIATVPETSLITHKIMVPNGVSGVVDWVCTDGQYSVNDIIAKVKTDDGTVKNLTMVQYWAIREPRPYKERMPISRPLITGQRVIDSFLPVGKGGTAAVPGGFGTGKTMTQHQLAKWSDADIIVYIGCGERGNEMTQVLNDFSKLVDPKSGKPLMDRTILIANTSNMPVAAREASIYTGITLAEYYRDMGYHVAIMADSTSRWAEALREISGRLEEMPAEEGFPAYLSSRLSAFYERAGYVENLNSTEGSITIIGAVSPQGGDFSEPVTQNTKRFVRCFWALDRSLAYSRHYPAIHWLNSYSEYIDDLSPWYSENVNPEFMSLRAKLLNLLQQESSLMDIVKLIGSDILPDEQKLVLEISRCIRLGFLQQNAYNAIDTYVPLDKQFNMMKIIDCLNTESQKIIDMGISLNVLKNTGIFEDVIKIKYEIENDKPEKFAQYTDKIIQCCKQLAEENK